MQCKTTLNYSSIECYIYNVTQSLREALLLIGADQDVVTETDFRAADNTVECCLQH